VFAYVDEPTRLAEWLPSIVEIRNVIGTGAGQQFEWTALTLEIEYGIPMPLLGRLAERFLIRRNMREFELALINVKETLES
jgi:hypothetical protein